jgi:hypothetical protein
MSWIDEIRQAAVSLNGGAPLPRRGRINFLNSMMIFLDNQVGYPPTSNGESYQPRLDATWKDVVSNYQFWCQDGPAANTDKWVWPNGQLLTVASGFAPIVLPRDVEFTSFSFMARIASPPEAVVCTVQKLVGVGGAAAPVDTHFKFTIPALTPGLTRIQLPPDTPPLILPYMTAITIKVRQAGTTAVPTWWGSWSLN